VARAKRTNRAEARRRYRATLAEDPDYLEAEDAALDAADGEEVTASRIRPRAAPTAPAQRAAAPAAPAQRAAARPGLASAFRSSFHPLDVRADLRGLPSLIRHRSVLLPVLLTLASAGFYAAVTPQIPAGGAKVEGTIPQVIASLLFQYFVWSPPVGSIFLAGFMAPRASYLTGAIAGLAGAVSFALVVSGRIGPFVQLDDVGLNQYVASALVVSPLAGVFFGGAAGWYRRFLTLANPNRAAQAAGRPNDRQRRRGNEPRPMLARRR